MIIFGFAGKNEPDLGGYRGKLISSHIFLCHRATMKRAPSVASEFANKLFAEMGHAARGAYR
jgi:hypothetical protein